MSQMADTVSAIVVTYETGTCLKDCLHTLACDPAVDELIIVDNGNPPSLTAWIDAFTAARPDTTYIPAGANIGFGAGVNLGAKAARGDALLLVNPDCLLKRGSVAAFQSAMKGHPGPILIGGRIFDIKGQEARGGRRRRLNLSRALLAAIGVDRLNLHRMPPPAEPLNVGAISGALCYMPKADFDALGGFDEAFFLHFEDLDLCERVLRQGGCVIYQPDAAGLHYGATSSVRPGFIARHKARSLTHYLKKHTTAPLQAPLVWCLAPVIGAVMRWRA